VSAVDVDVLEDAILVALGMNDIAEIGSPEGTATTIMRVPAIGAGICFSDHFPDKSAANMTTDCLDTDGVPVIPAFVSVVHFPFGL